MPTNAKLITMEVLMRHRDTLGATLYHLPDADGTPLCNNPSVRKGIGKWWFSVLRDVRVILPEGWSDEICKACQHQKAPNEHWEQATHHLPTKVEVDTTPYQPGDRVRHKIFGEGAVVSIGGSERYKEAVIAFPDRQRRLALFQGLLEKVAP